LSVETGEAVTTARTRAVMTMAYGGHPGQVCELRDWAASRGITLLEDAAHAIGASVDGRHLGTFGLAGAFSFFSNKNLAVGEGGMLVTDDADVAAHARLLRSHGMTTMSWERHSGHATGYDVVAAGFNYRIDEPRAALGRRRLERLSDENARRALLVERYRAALDDLAGIQLVDPPPAGAIAAHHLFTVVLAEDIDRDAVRTRLAERRIQTSVHYPPVHGFSMYREDAPTLRETEAYARRTVTLPLFAHMSERQLDLVIEALSSAVTG
jgi:dTDP-4-amino-4,6-dideoxygalactose transaminase